MGDLINVIAIIKGIPTEFTIALSVFVAIVAIWLKSRDIDITAATSISKLQMEQVNSLMNQNKTLTDNLKELRLELTKTYDIVDELKTKVHMLQQQVETYEHSCTMYCHKMQPPTIQRN